MSRYNYAPTPRKLKQEVWDKNGGICWYCGTELFWSKKAYNDPEAFTVDHFVPRTQGGQTALDNLVPCCKSCNASKHSKNTEQFRQLLAEREAWYNEGRPRFADEQIAYLDAIGIPLPPLPEIVFWFEEKGR